MLYIANVGVNRRVMKVKHLPVEMTLSSATTYGKHLRNTSRQDLKNRLCRKNHSYGVIGNDSNLLIVFYVQIMPDDFVMQLHRF